MTTSDNRQRLEIFGNYNRSMNSEVPFCFIDVRMSRVFNYIDRRIIRKWILSKQSQEKKKDLRILDVGAGTGRMTCYLSTIGKEVVSIEPYLPFFTRLKENLIATNTECYQCTLQEYFELSGQSLFDFIYVSGVLMYHIYSEALEFMKILNSLIKPDGLIIIRDLGISYNNSPSSNYDSLLDEDVVEVLRPPQGVLKLAKDSGLTCIKWTRPYPIDIPNKIYQKWPGKFSDRLITFFTIPFFYPFWYLLSLFNLPHVNKRCYFNYLFQKAQAN